MFSLVATKRTVEDYEDDIANVKIFAWMQDNDRRFVHTGFAIPSVPGVMTELRDGKALQRYRPLTPLTTDRGLTNNTIQSAARGRGVPASPECYVG
jgi:hypothetical protein